MKKLTIVFGILNQFDIATQALELAIHNLAEPKDTQIILIDNGSTTNYLNHISASVKTIADRVGELRIVRNPANVGNYPLFFQAQDLADGDAIAFLHSDLFIYGQGWDVQVKQCFRENRSSV